VLRQLIEGAVGGDEGALALARRSIATHGHIAKTHKALGQVGTIDRKRSTLLGLLLLLWLLLLLVLVGRL